MLQAGHSQVRDHAEITRWVSTTLAHSVLTLTTTHGDITDEWVEQISSGKLTSLLHLFLKETLDIAIVLSPAQLLPIRVSLPAGSVD